VSAGEVEHRCATSDQGFHVFGRPPIAAEQGGAGLNDPAVGPEDEPLDPIGALAGSQLELLVARGRPLALAAAVGEQQADEESGVECAP